MRLRARQGATLLVTSLAVLTAASLPVGRRQRRPRQPGRLGQPGGRHAARHERLGQRDHPGGQQDHRGRDLHLGEPGRHLRQHRRRPGPQPDLRLRRHHRRHRHRVQPQPRRRGQLAGHRRHLRLRRRAPSAPSAATAPSSGVVKLTAAGAVVARLQGGPQRGGQRGRRPRLPRLHRRRLHQRQVRGGSPPAAAALAALDADHRRRPRRGQRAVRRRLRPQQRGGGSTNVKRFDVTADGSRLAAVGNFATVGGQPRVQVAVLDTSGATATRRAVGDQPASTGPTTPARGVFDTFMRDVDFSPDGSYFVVSHDRRLRRRRRGPGPCATRSPAGRRPARATTRRWVDYTGGDTTYGVAVTGSAVYVGGHMRWFNNPFQGDQAGPGRRVPRGHRRPRPGQRAAAVVEPRPGARRGRPGAVRHQPGPLGRQRHHQDRQARRHGRIAFMPLAGRHHGARRRRPPRCRTTSSWPQRTAGGVLQRRAVDATGAPTGSPSTANTAMDWSTVRGAFLLNGTVYYGLADGAFYKRTFNTATGARRRPAHGQPARRPGHRHADPVRHREHDRDVLRPRDAPDLLHGVRRRPALLPVLHAGERGRGRPDVHRGRGRQSRSPTPPG